MKGHSSALKIALTSPSGSDGRLGLLEKPYDWSELPSPQAP